MVACSAKSALAFILTGGNVHDAPAGRELLDDVYSDAKHYMAMDRAYEGDETRQKAVERGFIPFVPPKSNRKKPWEKEQKA